MSKMERRAIFFAALLLAVYTPISRAADSTRSFDDSFTKSCPEKNFKTSEDGQIWYLSLDKDAGN